MVLAPLPFAGPAHAIDYCSFDNYVAPAYSVCTGIGQWCSVMSSGCSTIPGDPGTWNPRGYTPPTPGTGGRR